MLQRPESSPGRRWIVTGTCVEAVLVNMCGHPYRFPRQITQADQNTLRRFLILLLLTLIAIKIAILVGRGPAAIQADTRGYWELSSVVMRGDVLMMGEKIAYRTPGYPAFLAIVRLLSGSSLLAIIVLQAAMFLGIAWMAAAMAARISQHSWAKVTTLAIMLPGISSVVYVGAVLSETLFVFLLMLNLTMVMNYTKYKTSTSAVLVGLTFALTLLTRPIILLLWVAHVVLLGLVHLHRNRTVFGGVSLSGPLGHIALAFAVVMVMVMPWLVRNHLIFDKPFLTEFLGRNIWIVTFQDGSGAGLELPETQAAETLKRRLSNVSAQGDWSDINWRHTWTVSNSLVKSGLNDAQTDQLMKTVAWQAMKRNTSAARYKALRRVANFWRCPATDLPQPEPDFEGFGTYPSTWQFSVPGVTTGLTKAQEFRASQSVLANTIIAGIILLACIFLICWEPTRHYGVWIALILAYFCTVTGLVEIPDYRYRMIVEPIAAMTIGSAVTILWSRWRRIETDLFMEIDH